MKIVTTPMCEDILKYAGIKDYSVNKFPTKCDGDLAILLSESKTDLDSIALKLNTFSQIKESIRIVSKQSDKGEILEQSLTEIFKDYPLALKYLNECFGKEYKVKVYSNFLKDIVKDMGFKVVEDNYDFVVYPDYLKKEVTEKDNLVEIPSHSKVSKNPIERAILRYSILEDYINKEL